MNDKTWRDEDTDDIPDGEAEGRTRGLNSDDLTRTTAPAGNLGLPVSSGPIGRPVGAAVSTDLHPPDGHGR